MIPSAKSCAVTVEGREGIVTAPHHAAAAAGIAMLDAGGTAADAAVAVAATLAVVYPHMNSIGGDSFWLVGEGTRPPIGIEACGRAVQKATVQLYQRMGYNAVPWRGPLAANTVAGTLSGWERVLQIGGGHLSLAQILEPAIAYAEGGVEATESLVEILAAKQHELEDVFGFSEVFLPQRHPPSVGERLKQPALALTLRRLTQDGLDSAYRGALARDFAADLETAGTLIDIDDLQTHHATASPVLHVQTRAGRVFNMPPPTQGLASLMILALFDRLGIQEAEGFHHVHGLVEATKCAFRVRDCHVGDPAYMTVDPQALLDDGAGLDALSREISKSRATPWPSPPAGGDTVWFGVIDRRGQTVSAIQSTYFEFGSGIVLPQTGVIWQNRGASFRIAADGWNALRPRRKPFHTLNPALAHLTDGRVMAYGCMGGDGQPQTQAAIFSRYAMFGQDLQNAITPPRWLLGRTWGEQSASLKLEARFAPELIEALRTAGHSVDVLEDFTATMGHAGAVGFPSGRTHGRCQRSPQ